jgi:hypothetical protein
VKDLTDPDMDESLDDRVRAMKLLPPPLAGTYARMGEDAPSAAEMAAELEIERCGPAWAEARWGNRLTRRCGPMNSRPTDQI